MPANFRQLLTLVCVGLSVAGRCAGAADPDPTFGTGGKVITDVSGRYDEIRAVVVQADGRIVAAGVTGATPHRDFALVRYNTDGTLDRGFGNGGAVITDFAGGDDVAWSLALQPDGRIIVGGTADGDFALARYTVGGTLDDHFGGDGRIAIDLGGDDRINALVVQADGKIVCAGVAGGVDFAIARFDVNGEPDAMFGRDGHVITDFSAGADTAFAVGVRQDGRIIAAGSAGSCPVARFAVAQYNVDGSLDETFGTGGKTIVRFGRDAGAHALAVQPDNKVIIGGFINNGSSGPGVVARLTARGTLDPSFGAGGTVEMDFGGRNFGSALLFQPDGRVVVAGFDDFPPYYDFVIGRFEPDGNVDRSFNSNTTILTEFGANSWINTAALQPDGKIVAAGYARGSSSADFALVRYWTNP
jgi:uncharacterized delta-60 repeat protein